MSQFLRGEPNAPGRVVERPVHPAGHHERGDTWAEEIFAAGGLTLAIIGLAGAAPAWLDTIAIIALGVAFLCERWSVTARQRGGTFADGVSHRGLAVEAVVGWTGVVLGILSLLRLAPTVLAPIALIALGVGLALGTGLGSRWGRVVIGCGAIVLGILSIIQIDPRTLTLIGLIGVGGVMLLGGPLFAGRKHPVAPPPAAFPMA